jgi:hypothetical protein
VGKMRSDSIFEYSYQNAATYQNQGTKINITIPLHKKIILMSSFDLYESKISYQENSYDLFDWTNYSQLMYVDQEKNTVVGLQYQKNMSKIINAQGYTSNDIDFWMVFFQKPFFKDKLSVMLGYMLPINFIVNYEQESYVFAGDYNKTTKTDFNIVKNVFLFQLSYRFQKGKAIKKTSKTDRKEAEKESNGIF